MEDSIESVRIALEKLKIHQETPMDGIVFDSNEGKEPMTVIPNKCMEQEDLVEISKVEALVTTISVQSNSDINTENEHQNGIARVQSEHPFIPVARIHQGVCSESESVLNSSCNSLPGEHFMDNKTRTAIPPVEHLCERKKTLELELEEKSELSELSETEENADIKYDKPKMLNLENSKKSELIISNPCINDEWKQSINEEIGEIWIEALRKCGLDEMEQSQIPVTSAIANVNPCLKEESEQTQFPKKADTLVISGSVFLDMSCPQYRPSFQNYGDSISLRESKKTNFMAKPTLSGIGLDVLKLMMAAEECTPTKEKNECVLENAQPYFLSHTNTMSSEYLDLDEVLGDVEILEMSPDDLICTTRTIEIEEDSQSEVELCDFIEEGDIMEITDPEETYTNSLLEKMSESSFYKTYDSYAKELMPSEQDVLPEDDVHWIGNFKRPKSADSIDDEVDIEALENRRSESEDICFLDNTNNFCEHFEQNKDQSEEDANDILDTSHQCDVNKIDVEEDIEAIAVRSTSHDSDSELNAQTENDSTDTSECDLAKDALKDQNINDVQVEIKNFEVSGNDSDSAEYSDVEFYSGSYILDAQDNKEREGVESETKKIVFSGNCICNIEKMDTDTLEKREDSNYGENNDSPELEEFSRNKKTTYIDEDILKLKVDDYVDNEVSDGDNSQVEVDKFDEISEDAEKARDFGDFLEFGSVIALDCTKNETKSELGKIVENNKPDNATHFNMVSEFSFEVSNGSNTKSSDKSEKTENIIGDLEEFAPSQLLDCSPQMGCKLDAHDTNENTQLAQKPVVECGAVKAKDQENQYDTTSINSVGKKGGACPRISKFFNRLFGRQLHNNISRKKKKAIDPTAGAPLPSPRRTFRSAIRHLFSRSTRVLPMDIVEL